MPDLVLTSLLLCAIEKQYPDFALNVEALLSNPSIPSNQKTFEHTFGRFRMEYYRRKARQEEEEDETDFGVHSVQQKEHCVICNRIHRRGCWVKYPELASSDLQDYFKRKYQEWKAKGALKEIG